MTIFFEGGSPPPPPPDSAEWDRVLIWCLAVMNESDTSLSFISGCLGFYAKPTGDGALTDRQERGCEKVFLRLVADYENEQLDCQNVGLSDD